MLNSYDICTGGDCGEPILSGLNLVNRNTDEVIILFISGAISLCLIPFSIIRFVQGEIAVAILNTTAIVFTSAFFLNVLLTHRTTFSRWGLSTLSVLVMTATIYLKGAEQVLWVYPALTIIFYLLSANTAAIICLVFMLATMLMIWPQLEQMELLRFGVSAGATFLFCYAFSARMRGHALVLSKLATTDPLTGAGNRRALEEKLLENTTRLRRYPEQSCSVILFDIDHFKLINDNHGHNIGDKVLAEFTSLVTERIRESDSLYRYGGEEFVVVLENTDVLEAVKLAIEIGNDVSTATWRVEKLSVTVSSGIAQFLGEESARDWIVRADNALYKAKGNGRNCCFADENNVVQLVRQARESGHGTR